MKKIVMVVIIISLIVAVARVEMFWQDAQHQVYPDRGDYDFYLESCNNMPPHEHPVVPAILHIVNFVLRNPDASVLLLMMIAFASVSILVFSFTHLTTGNIYASLYSFFIMIISVPNFLSPTALKNIVGIAFLLLSLTLLQLFIKTRCKKHLAFLVTSSVLTCLTHSLPIIGLLAVFAAYAFQWRKIVVLFGGLTLLFLATLALTGRLYKLELTLRFLNISTLTYNLNRLSTTWIMAPYLALFLVTTGFGFIHQLWTKRFNPIFTGLDGSAIALLLCGLPPFAGRLYVTTIPLLAVLCGLTMHFSMEHVVKGDLKNEGALDKPA